MTGAAIGTSKQSLGEGHGLWSSPRFGAGRPIGRGQSSLRRYPLDDISSRTDTLSPIRSPDASHQVEEFMSGLPQYPDQPTRSIVDAVDVLAETGPTLGRPLVDRIELEPDHRDLTRVFGRRLKELRPLGTEVRILFTFAPDRTLILLYAGDKAGEWNDW